jgi:hypothetical protein
MRAVHLDSPIKSANDDFGCYIKAYRHTAACSAVFMGRVFVVNAVGESEEPRRGCRA